MSIFVGQLIQGQGNTLTLTTVTGAFAGTESLAGSLSTGGTDAAVLLFTPTWTSGQETGSYKLLDVSFTASQTAALAPGYYVLQANLADNTAALAWGLIEVVAAAGQQPVYDWLVQPAEVLGLVPDIVTVDNLADLPRVITAASEAVRRYCNRHFTRRTRTREFVPSQGQVLLDEIPVHQVLRIACRQTAMRIIGPTSAQIARMLFAYTDGSPSGVILTSTTSAVTVNATLAFADYPTIDQLAAAVRSQGWTCTVVGGFGDWPSTELVGGDVAQGALSGDGAWLDVYSDDAALEYLDHETGMLWLSRTSSSSLDTPAWGPDWNTFASPRPYPARVKVTYDAGFDAIPSPVVMAVVETVQNAFIRTTTNQAIKSERAGDYSYTLRDRIDSIPESARTSLSLYRIFNA